MLRPMVDGVTCLYRTNQEPDPDDPVDVLAFVLCQEKAFVDGDDPDELEACRELLGPAKAKALTDWYQRNVAN